MGTRGTSVAPPANESPLGPRSSNLDPIANPDRYEQTHANMPIQPDGEYRVRGFNSFAQLLARGGEFSPDVAQQVGYRVPRPKGLDAALNSSWSVAIVDRDVFATAPGASAKDEVEYARPDGPATEGQRVLKNAASLLSAFHWQFDECSVDPGPVDDILSAATRYAGAVCGRKRFCVCVVSSVPCAATCAGVCSGLPRVAPGPRVVAAPSFLGDVAPALRVEPHLSLRGLAEFPDLSGALRGSGRYVHHDAARPHALRQQVVRFWLASAVYRCTGAVTVEGLAVFLGMMCRDTKPEVSRPLSSNGPQGCNTVLGNVVGLTVFGVVGNYDGGAALHLCVPLMGKTPSDGKQHLCFAPDARPWCNVTGSFAVGQMLPTEDGALSPFPLCDRRNVVERDRNAGAFAARFEFVAACPSRFSAGKEGAVSWACVPCRFPIRCGAQRTSQWSTPRVFRWTWSMRAAPDLRICPRVRSPRPYRGPDPA